MYYHAGPRAATQRPTSRQEWLRIFATAATREQSDRALAALVTMDGEPEYPGDLDARVEAYLAEYEIFVTP